MSRGFLSRLFSAQPLPEGPALEEKSKLIEEQLKTIVELKEELRSLQLSKTQTPVICQVWKPVPPSRYFNLSGVGSPCEWVLPCLRQIPPELARTFDVASFDFESDQVYQVDLSGHSCTCPDFTKRRQELPLGHALRCCNQVGIPLLQGGRQLDTGRMVGCCVSRDSQGA